MESSNSRGRLAEVAALSARLGVMAFGGPAAHIAMLEEEVVERRRWLDRQSFLDLLGATQLVPGPNSTEMVMHAGYVRAGRAGLFVAGFCFILPAALLTLLIAALYQRFGTLPQAEPLLVGVQAAVLALIAGALWRLTRKAVKGWPQALIAAAVAAAAWAGLPAAIALLAGGVAGMILIRARSGGAAALWMTLALGLAPPARALAQDEATTVSLARLGLFFLKVGSVLYGSGYVLIAFIEADLVDRFGWLTRAELLDAVAAGQMTPGPVLTTATFVGYLTAGVGGAAVATVAIFLPSFIFVLLISPWIPRLRQSVWASAFLDAVSAAAVALMILVTWNLATDTLVSPWRWGITLAALIAALGFRVKAPWLLAGGALVGFLGSALGVL